MVSENEELPCAAELDKIPKGQIRVTIVADFHSGTCERCLDGFKALVEALGAHDAVEQPKKRGGD